MEVMEVDNPKENISSSITTEPMEGTSGTDDKLPTLTFQTKTVKSDLNTPWFVYYLA